MNVKKWIIFTVALASVAAAKIVGASSIEIGFPAGNELLQRDSSYNFAWQTPSAMSFDIYVDHYDSAANVTDQMGLASWGLYPAGGYGFNFDQYNACFVDTNGTYRMRVVGHTTNTIYVTESNPFSFVGNPPLFGTFEDADPAWRPGQQKTVTIAWNGYNPGDAFSLFLFDSEQWVGEGYGFLLTTGVLATASGSMQLTVDYPTSAEQIDPDPMYGLTDGIHQFMIQTPGTGTLGGARYWFGKPNMVVSDVSVRMMPSVPKAYLQPQATVRACELEIDARFAPTDLLITNLSLSLDSSTSNCSHF